MNNYFINEKGQALIHWGTVDAPEMTPFNGNSDNILKNVVNPERVIILKPGEEYIVE